MDNQQPGRYNIMKYTKEEFKQRVIKEMPESNVEIIEFTGLSKPLKVYCNKCKNIISFSTANHGTDRGRRGLKNICNICEDTKQYSRRIKQIERMNKILPNTNLELVSEVKRVKDKATFRCKKCGETFERNLYEFFKRQTCPYCEGMVSHYTRESFEKKMRALGLSEHYELIGDFKNSVKPTLFKHKDCGFIWKCAPSSIIAGHGCPKCKLSRGEIAVANALKNCGIEFKQQYRFKNTALANQPFDFYFMYNNQEYCIEYQGQQHFYSVDWFGGEEKFKSQQINDQRKRDFCKLNNIELIEISYKDFNNIDNIISQRFNDQPQGVDSSESKHKPSKDEDIV